MQNDSRAITRAGSVRADDACVISAGVVELRGGASVFTELLLEGGEISGTGDVNANSLLWTSGNISGASTFTAENVSSLPPPLKKKEEGKNIKI